VYTKIDMVATKKTFSNLRKDCYELVEKLNWQTYHTPENLASILVGEVGELAELCVWLTKEQIIEKKSLNKNVTEELADVVKATLYLFNSLHLDLSLETLVSRKLEYEDIRYPIAEFKGLSKYEKLTVDEEKKTKTLALPKKNIRKIYTIDELESWAWDNSRGRSWDTYYTPASLCLGIFEDCSKIYTSFQRRTNKLDKPFEKLVWAISGILILTLRMHTFLGLADYYGIVEKKLKKDLKRFSTH
jgi:NTP pyrophosphatase (non-canonical NTP hydrolase)